MSTSTIPQYRTVPASKPMKAQLFSGADVGFDTIYRLNESGSDYVLYANKGFAPIPEGGDPYGLVAQVQIQAARADSGVTNIQVTSHRLSICCSLAQSREGALELLRRAYRAAGMGNAAIEPQH